MEIEIYKRYYDPIEANIVANKLKVNGIECFLTNEHSTTMLWHLNIAHGGVALMMNSDDFSKADSVLLNDNSVSIEEDECQNIRCSKCKSNNISYGTNTAKINWWQLLISLLMVFPAPIPMNAYHCHKCGNNFKVKNRY